jgi:methanesulfonate monooxygenase subunit beta
MVTQDISAVERSVERLIQRSLLLLDEERFDDFLALCTSGFQYELKTYSAEIRKDMTWLAADRDELDGLFQTLPRHVLVGGALLRQASISDIEIDTDGTTARAIAAMTIIHTDVDGQSKLLAAGRYHDTVSLDGDRPLLRERIVRLHTRVFDNEAGGSHVPF